jgi:carbonic anhydrase
METWLDPSRFAGVTACDHVVRNAGGRATDDAIRSLLLSYKLLDAREWFVIHHTDCDLEVFNDETTGRFLDSRQAAAAPKRKPASVVADVRRIRRHPLVPGDITIYGYIFDAHSGKLHEVSEATTVGAAREQAGFTASRPETQSQPWPRSPSLR